MRTCRSPVNQGKMSDKLCEEMNMEKKSGIFRELNSIPVVNSATSFISSVRKQSRILNTGMAIFEYSVTSVIDRLYDGFSLTSKIDSAGEKGLATLKERYPVVTQSPDELQDTISTSMRKTVRLAMKTPPGRLMLGGLDWAIQNLSLGLKHLNTNKQSGTKVNNKPALTQVEHSYASEDSGACDTDMTSRKEPHSALSALTQQDSLLSKTYTLGVLYPMEKLLSVLKCSRRFVAGTRRKEKRSVNGDMNGGRTIKSPRKRVQATLWTRMKTAALKLLGARLDSRLINIMFYSSSKEPVSPGRAERKRTHDEILTDEDGSESSDGESADVLDLDLENYDSDEDPDYEPNDQEESDDTASSGDPESDFEPDPIEELPDSRRQKKGNEAQNGTNNQNGIKGSKSPKKELKDASKGSNSPKSGKTKKQDKDKPADSSNKNDQQQKGKGGQPSKGDQSEPVVYLRDVASLPQPMKDGLVKQQGGKIDTTKQNGTGV